MFENIISADFNSYILIAIKIFFIVSSILYFVFSLLIVKQVSAMSQNVNDKFNQILKIFSYLHLVFSVILVLSMFAL